MKYLGDAMCLRNHLIAEGMLRVVLIHAGPVILPELDERLGNYAERRLSGRKVEVHLNTKVESFSGKDGPIE
jgi:NADH dehydrogenase FAD-containing subunit